MHATVGRQSRRIAVHGGRVAIFVMVIVLIHLNFQQYLDQERSAPAAKIDLTVVRHFFPQAALIGTSPTLEGGREVFDAQGTPLGQVLQTSPSSDHIIGFSGPTNMLIALGPGGRIVGVDVLSSRDTRDHVRQVQQESRFFDHWHGQTWAEAATGQDVDAVTGATLTSRAIQEAIIHRMGGQSRSLRFPKPITVADVRSLFSQAASVQQDAEYASFWHVHGHAGELGSVLRTSPAADNIIGYQGPTDTLIGFATDGRIVGIAVGTSYDNEPYVAYLRDDAYFQTLFNGLILKELATYDLEKAEVDGVSGATMTSMAVAHGLVRAAARHEQAIRSVQAPANAWLAWTWRDCGTASVILVGLIVGLTSLRSNKLVRVVFLFVLVVYLGFVNGDMLSQAMIVGWAQSGIPWRNAGGLILLTATAFLVPLTTRRNIYCSHLCPHGAAQQLLKRRLPWQVRLPRGVSSRLRMIPSLLLAWCIVVGMTLWTFSLVDIEPFDAWVYYVAGGATLTIAIVGLVASLFVPMAYCRYGCPTGALLNYLRFSSSSGRWTRRDWIALALVALAVGLWLI